jgi:hypothetical protein
MMPSTGWSQQMLAAANPHAIAITIVMPKLINEDSREVAAIRLNQPQDALRLAVIVSPFSNALGIAAARGLALSALSRVCNLSIRRSHQRG